MGNGWGSSSETAERIFDAFFTTKSDGLGMGLVICRSLIEAHGGCLWAEPNPGGGTIFRFTLPLQTELRTGVSLQEESNRLASLTSSIAGRPQPSQRSVRTSNPLLLKIARCSLPEAGTATDNL